MKKFLLVTLVLPLLLLAACEDPQSNTARNEMNATDANQAALDAAQPLPQLTESLERNNLIKRLTRLNKQNANGYVYFLEYGKVMAYYPVKGKCSSLNAYLTPSQQVVRWPETSVDKFVVDSPDLDGTYGKNDDGIFCFTADTDAYVEWHGDYMYTDQPLQLSTPPELVRSVK